MGFGEGGVGHRGLQRARGYVGTLRQQQDCGSGRAVDGAPSIGPDSGDGAKQGRPAGAGGTGEQSPRACLDRQPADGNDHGSMRIHTSGRSSPRSASPAPDAPTRNGQRLIGYRDRGASALDQARAGRGPEGGSAQRGYGDQMATASPVTKIVRSDKANARAPACGKVS